MYRDHGFPLQSNHTNFKNIVYKPFEPSASISIYRIESNFNSNSISTYLYYRVTLLGCIHVFFKISVVGRSVSDLGNDDTS